MNVELLLRFVHIAAAAIWVGGMFFAYVCLRPAAAELLEPPPRLRLWRAVLARFLGWVWVTVILIGVTGMVRFGRAGSAAPPNWHVMMGSGLLMFAIFVYVYTVPFAALRHSVDAEDWAQAGVALGRIRQAVGWNLLLGLLTICVATLGAALG